MTDITDEKAANDQAFEIVSAYLRANGLTMTMDGVASAMRLVKFATAELRRFAELARQDERQDAERYRWLRGEVQGPHVPLAQVVWKRFNIRDSGDWTNLADGTSLDEHIDRARGSDK